MTTSKRHDDDTTVFSDTYAALYDTTYGTKDYAAEAGVVDQLVQRHCAGARRLLDYGCGTGNHAAPFLDLGYSYTGVDREPNMLKRAREKLAGRDAVLLDSADRDTVPDASTDVVVCLFDVVSYMNENAELLDFLAYCHRVLVPGGGLIFDFWHGPGVIHLGPEVRVKEWNTSEHRILRIATPDQDWARSVVRLTFDMHIFDRRNHLVERLRETHPMRYFFQQDIEMALTVSGFSPVRFGTWADTSRAPTLEDWSALVLARKDPA